MRSDHWKVLGRGSVRAPALLCPQSRSAVGDADMGRRAVGDADMGRRAVGDADMGRRAVGDAGYRLAWAGDALDELRIADALAITNMP